MQVNNRTFERGALVALLTLVAFAVPAQAQYRHKLFEVAGAVGGGRIAHEVFVTTPDVLTFEGSITALPLPYVGVKVAVAGDWGASVDEDVSPVGCCGKPLFGGTDGSDFRTTSRRIEVVAQYPFSLESGTMVPYVSAGKGTMEFDTDDPDLQDDMSLDTWAVGSKFHGGLSLFGEFRQVIGEIERAARRGVEAQRVEVKNWNFAVGLIVRFGPDLLARRAEPEKPAPVPAPEPRPEVCRDYPSDILDSGLEEGDRWLYFGMGPKDPATLHVVGRHQGRMILAERGDAEPFTAIFMEDLCEPGQYHEYRPEESIRGTTG